MERKYKFKEKSLLAVKYNGYIREIVTLLYASRSDVSVQNAYLYL